MASPSSRVQIALRGTLIALVAAGVVGAVLFAAVMLIGGNFDDAVRAGSYVAAGYLALNLAVLLVGLLVRPSESWAVGAALATPVVVAAIGFGYSIFRGYPL
jgi:hypothetical protein